MTATVRLTELAPGNPGIVETARRMRVMIRAHDPLTRQTAEDALLTLQGQPDTFEQAEALYQWVQDHLQYVHDHVNVEEVRDSNYLIRAIRSSPSGRAAGDCDDYVVLLGSLLMAVGIVTDIVLTSARPDGEYDHVFLVVHTNRGAITADAIPSGPDGQREYQPMGWEVPAAAVTNRYVLPVSGGAGEQIMGMGQDSTIPVAPGLTQPFADPSTGSPIDASAQDPFNPGVVGTGTSSDAAGIITTTYANGASLETHPDGSYVYNGPDQSWTSFDASTGQTTIGSSDGSTVTYDASYTVVSSTPPTVMPAAAIGAVVDPSGHITSAPSAGWTPQAVNALLGTVASFGTAALKTYAGQVPAAARRAPAGYAWSYPDTAGVVHRTTDLSRINFDQISGLPTLVPISGLPRSMQGRVTGAGLSGLLTQKIGPLPVWGWGVVGVGAVTVLGGGRRGRLLGIF